MIIIPRNLNLKNWAEFGLIAGILKVLLTGILIFIGSSLLVSVVNIGAILDYINIPVDIVTSAFAGSLLFIFITLLLSSIIFWILAGFLYYIIKPLIIQFNEWQLVILGAGVSIGLGILFNTLGAGTIVKIHTGSGNNTKNDLYWNNDYPIWNNNGDTAFLYDKDGYLIDTYEYP